MSDIKGNGIVTDIDTLEGTLSELVSAEKKARGECEKLTAALERCLAERADIAGRKLEVSQQLATIYKRQAGGKGAKH